jgi:hypothetical protein
MRLPIFALLLAVAFVGTAVALRLGLTVRDEAGIQFATALSAGALVVWLLVTVSAFTGVTVSGGSTITNSYPSLGALGVIGAGVSTLILGKGSLTLLNQ